MSGNHETQSIFTPDQAYKKENGLPTNIQVHFLEQQSIHPEATGALTTTLIGLSLVAKEVSYLVNTAGLKDIHGFTGETNIQGEKVLKLDECANEKFKSVLRGNPYVAGYASEEESTFVSFDQGPRRKYIVWSDPLDGSSNFDTGVSIGSIFGIYKRVSDIEAPVEEKDFLQRGKELVCAGYFLYGSSTQFVYTTGHGVYGFTLDPSIGEFVLPKDYSNIKTPEIAKTYSVNEGYSNRWSSQVTKYIQHLKSREDDPCSLRYIGSMVADFHRNLLKGGVFLYPADTKSPNGKLRICCELNPLAFIAEQAGGMATDGLHRILDIEPKELHQRSPVVIGSKREVELFKNF